MGSFETKRVRVLCSEVGKTVEIEELYVKSVEYIDKMKVGINRCFEANCPVQNCKYNQSSKIKNQKKQIEPIIIYDK